MTKALIVIDVQESFRQQPVWPLTANPDIVEKVNRLVDHARLVGDLRVVHRVPQRAPAERLLDVDDDQCAVHDSESDRPARPG